MPLHQVTTPRLKIYSACPKQYEYYLPRELPEEAPLSVRTTLLKKIICSAYISAARSRRTPWRRMTNILDEYVFSSPPDRTDPLYDQKMDQLFKHSIKLIKFMKKSWYEPHYLNSGLAGFPSLRVGLTYGDILLHDQLDLVLFNENDLILCAFSDIDAPTSLLYNDMKTRAQILLLAKNTGRPVTQVRHFSWPEEDYIKITNIHLHPQKEFMAKTESAVNHLITGINNKVFYPSISAQCASCPFNSICSF
jgi:hypothetical protein